MPRRMHAKILLLVAASLAVALLLNTWLVVREFETGYRAALLGKLSVAAVQFQRWLASTLDLGVGLDEVPGVADQARALAREHREIAYVAVVDAGGRLLHSSAGSAAEAAALGRALAATPLAPFEAGGAPLSWGGESLLDAGVALPKGAGAVRLGLRTSVAAAEMRAIWLRASVVGLAVLVASFLVVVPLVSTTLTVPVRRLVETAERIAAGDLTQRARERGDDEVSALGRAFNRMAGRLQGLLRRIDATSAQVAGASGAIAGGAGAVLSDAEAQARSVEETARSVSTMNRSVSDVLASIDRLTQAAQTSSSSVLEMGAAVEQVAGNMEHLAASVEQTTGSIEEVAAASRQIAAGVDSLTGLASETALAIRQLEAAIRAVDENARETSALSERVQQDAEAGIRAVEATVAGIERIKDSSSRASEAIVGLGERIRSIDSILAIIDDVAEETNLLALNAAIIAAQAGEHGRGFSVVAEEIKALAERTGASTREIAEQVRRIQTEAAGAVEAMLAGAGSVEEGVRLARQAGGVLAQIAESAARSGERVRGIARATAEQSEGSRQMTAAVGQVAAMAQKISSATREQSRGGEQILQAVERMREIAHQVRQTTEEQAKGSRHITRSIEEMTELIVQIHRATKEHGDSSRLVEAAVERIKATTRRNLDSAGGLRGVVEALGREAKALRDEVGRFQI
jgi:methyl-accepting chemotaxis protein